MIYIKNIFEFANQREGRKEKGERQEAVKGGGGREGVRGRG